MKIKDVLHSVGRSGLFNTDFAASKAGARRDGFLLVGAPVTPGFERIVQPGFAISVMLVLEDGQVAFGDCVDVILAGIAGRDPLFRPEAHVPFLRGPLREALIGRDVSRFRPLAEEVDRMMHGGRPVHAAVRYGVTQALLHAAALATRRPMAGVISREYDCPIASSPLPLLANCRVDDPNSLDRVILKEAALLPHGAFMNVERDLGLRGEKLLDFARAVVRRIAEIGAPGYRPTIHLDVYGTLGDLFDCDVARITGFLAELEATVAPHPLMIESPIIMKTRDEQIQAYLALGEAIRRAGLQVETIVDEWCNTLDDVIAFSDAEAGDLLQVKTPDLGGINNAIEAVLYARRRGRGVSLGGSLNETDQSSRVTVHIGLACGPTYIFAKPGYGSDEAMMLQGNEMARTLAILQPALGAAVR